MTSFGEQQRPPIKSRALGMKMGKVPVYGTHFAMSEEKYIIMIQEISLVTVTTRSTRMSLS